MSTTRQSHLQCYHATDKPTWIVPLGVSFAGGPEHPDGYELRFYTIVKASMVFQSHTTTRFCSPARCKISNTFDKLPSHASTLFPRFNSKHHQTLSISAKNYRFLLVIRNVLPLLELTWSQLGTWLPNSNLEYFRIRSSAISFRMTELARNPVISKAERIRIAKCHGEYRSIFKWHSRVSFLILSLTFYG